MSCRRLKSLVGIDHFLLKSFLFVRCKTRKEYNWILRPLCHRSVRNKLLCLSHTIKQTSQFDLFNYKLVSLFEEWQKKRKYCSLNNLERICHWRHWQHKQRIAHKLCKSDTHKCVRFLLYFTFFNTLFFLLKNSFMKVFSYFFLNGLGAWKHASIVNLPLQLNLGEYNLLGMWFIPFSFHFYGSFSIFFYWRIIITDKWLEMEKVQE